MVALLFVHRFRWSRLALFIDAFKFFLHSVLVRAVISLGTACSVERSLSTSIACCSDSGCIHFFNFMHTLLHTSVYFYCYLFVFGCWIYRFALFSLFFMHSNSTDRKVYSFV